MSRTEFHTCKLYPINFGKDLEGYCKRIAAKHNITLNLDWRQSFTEAFDHYEKERGSVSEEYFIHNENLWQVIDHTSHDDSTACAITSLGDGGLAFQTRFHNGGTCFSGELEEALNDHQDQPQSTQSSHIGKTVLYKDIEYVIVDQHLSLHNLVLLNDEDFTCISLDWPNVKLL